MRLHAVILEKLYGLYRLLNFIVLNKPDTVDGNFVEKRTSEHNWAS